MLTIPPILCALALLLSLKYLYDYCVEGPGIDMEIFQLAGQQMRHGGALYENFMEETGVGLAYIYPPFAAILFIPLSFFSLRAVTVFWTILTFFFVWGILYMVTRRLATERSARYAAVLSLFFTGPAMLFEPVAAGIHFTQVDLFLFLLVALDVLGFLPRRLRGLGIGLAAGIKVTPAAFAVIFLARRDWYGIAVSAFTFLATVALGFIVTPAQSMEFWTDVAWDTKRGGTFNYMLNESVSGLLASAGMSDGAIQHTMTFVLLFCAVVALWVSWKFTQVNRGVSAFAFVLLSVLLSAPIAVTHHWAGIIIFIPMAFMMKDRLLSYGFGLMVVNGLLIGWNNHGGYVPDRLGDFMYENSWAMLRAMCIIGLIMYSLLLMSAIRINLPKKTQD
ncbi:MAG: glycosyltransferase 87 family protein [Corynebacterium sp.]|nr:glycosyltransferase 87 family protein [Corynebacterium sp.]